MRRRARAGWIGWLLVLILGCGLIIAWPRGGREQFFALTKKIEQLAPARASPSAAPPPRDVPVVTAISKKGDLPIHIDGLGTATPFQSVVVRSRVDGQLLHVSFQEGAQVKEGDTIVEIDPRPFLVQLQQAEGQLAKDQSLLKNAQLDLKRYQDAGKVVPDQQRATQAALVTQIEGTLKTDAAAIDNAKLQLSYTHILAPLTGRIGLRQIDAGNMIRASDPAGFATITQLQPIAVVFSIAQDYIANVMRKTRNGEQLQVEAWDRDLKNRLATGTLVAVDNEIDTGTGTVRLKAKFDNTDNSLFPNQFVNARLLIDTRKGAIIVPGSGIQRGPDSTFAYVVKADKTVEMRPIKQGPIEGDLTVVESGLKENEEIVTDGADKLVQGTKVTTKVAGKPDAKPDGKPDEKADGKAEANGDGKSEAKVDAKGDGQGDKPKGEGRRHKKEDATAETK